MFNEFFPPNALPVLFLLLYVCSHWRGKVTDLKI